MKYLKAIIILILSLIVLTLIVAIFMPKEYYIERTIKINKPVDSVFYLVSDLNNYIKWDPWSNQESDKFYKISGNGINQIYEWDGDTVGKGKLEITEMELNKKIKHKITFIKPWENIAYNEIIFSKDNGQSLVIWKMYGDLDYPFGRFMKNMIENMVGKDFEKGLKNLKLLAEKN